MNVLCVISTELTAGDDDGLLEPVYVGGGVGLDLAAQLVVGVDPGVLRGGGVHPGDPH